MTTRRMRTVAVGAVIALAITGCAGATSATPSPAASSATTVPGDGVLRIGTLLPDKGDNARIAQAQVAAVELAVSEINAAGGVGGAPVEVYHRNSGDPASTSPALALDALIAKGVDVVIGPSTSAELTQLAPAAAAAGVLLISPSASGELPTGGGAIELTRAAESAATATAATALAAAILAAGGSSVAYLHTDNNADFATELTRAIEGTGSPRVRPYYPRVGALVADVAIDPSRTTDAGAAVSQAVTAGADAYVASADEPRAASVIVTALHAAGIAGNAIYLATGATGDYSGQVPAGSLAGATGVVIGARPDAAFAARIRQADPAVSRFDFALEAYDATMFAALAAQSAGSDSGLAVGAAIAGVTHGGIPCSSFGECAAVLKDRPNIDYNGITGIALGGNGRATGSAFSIVTYDEAGRFAVSRIVVVG